METQKENAKARELLPDVEGHLKEMLQLQADLNTMILPFEDTWAHLLPSDEPTPAPKLPAKEPTPVDRVYMGMRANETGLQELIKRLKKIQQNYLGAK